MARGARAEPSERLGLRQGLGLAWAVHGDPCGKRLITFVAKTTVREVLASFRDPRRWRAMDRVRVVIIRVPPRPQGIPVGRFRGLQHSETGTHGLF